MNKDKALIAAAVCAFSLLVAAPLKAASYDLYVNSSNNTGVEDGTSANPYNTIGEALSAASEGQSIFINNGTYVENIEVPRDVEVYGEDKSKVIIDGGDNGTTVKLNHKSKLKKVTVKGGDRGIKVPEKAGVTISKVKVKDADHDGITLEGSGATRGDDKYERTIKDTTVKSNGAKGMYIQKSQVTIEDSEISDNEEEGIDMRKGVKVSIKSSDIEDNDEGNIEFKLDNANITIKKNDITGAKASGIAAQSYQGKGGEITIENNDIKGNSAYGLRCAVQQHKPEGGWGSQIFLIQNMFSNNKKGNISPTCGF